MISISVLSFLLCIIHYFRVFFIQGHFSESRICLDIVPNWTGEQLQTITPANHELVGTQNLRCEVGSCFESQLIKQDFGVILYILSMLPCREMQEDNYFSLLRRLQGTYIPATLLSLNPKTT